MQYYVTGLFINFKKIPAAIFKTSPLFLCSCLILNLNRITENCTLPFQKSNTSDWTPLRSVNSPTLTNTLFIVVLC